MTLTWLDRLLVLVLTHHILYIRLATISHLAIITRRSMFNLPHDTTLRHSIKPKPQRLIYRHMASALDRWTDSLAAAGSRLCLDKIMLPKEKKIRVPINSRRYQTSFLLTKF